ncbi:MAG: hypothetical protein V4539_03795 [Bacteroidota bacterium]
MKAYSDSNKKVDSKSAANESSEKPVDGHAKELTDSRPGSEEQGKLQQAANNSAQVQQLKAFQEMADNRPQPNSQKAPVQAVTATRVIQMARTVSNKQMKNMKSVVKDHLDQIDPVNNRKLGDILVDQNSGRAISDGAPHFTTGHHGIIITDNATGKRYSCDFHQNGTYFTRFSRV